MRLSSLLVAIAVPSVYVASTQSNRGRPGSLRASERTDDYLSAIGAGAAAGDGAN